MNPAPSSGATGGRDVRGSRSSGMTVIETTAALAIAAILASMTVPALAAGRDRFRAAGAARHLAALVQEARSRAIHGGVAVALRFSGQADAPAVAVIVDGNRNGVRTAEISRGIDRQVGPVVWLNQDFPGVDCGLVPGVTDIDTGAPLSGSGLKVGSAGMISFAPTGAASSGTVYLRGRGQLQYAVRVLGGTGRVRVLRFDADARRWGAP